MSSDGVGGAGPSKPIDLGAFPGTSEAEQKQLGSDGRLKGKKVSKPKNFRKLLQHGTQGREVYHQKRAKQLNISERRVQTLESLQKPSSVAASLDGASFTLADKKFTVHIKEDHLLKNLKTVTDETLLDKDVVVSEGRHKLTAMTKKGSRSRAQADNTTYLRETIAKTETPHGLMHALSTLGKAKDEGHITKNQAKELKSQIQGQLQEQHTKLHDDFSLPPSCNGDELREAYIGRLNNILELTAAMSAAGGEIMENTGPSGSQEARKDLRDLALDTYQASVNELTVDPQQLTETQRRLDHSKAALDDKLKPILNATCSKNKRANHHFKQASARAESTHFNLKTKINGIRVDHQGAHKLLQQSIPDDRAELSRLEAEQIILKETKTGKKPTKFKERIAEKEKAINASKAELSLHQQFLKARTKKLEAQKAQFTDSDKFYSASGPGGVLRKPAPSGNSPKLNWTKEASFSEQHTISANKLLDTICPNPRATETVESQTATFASNHLQELVQERGIEPEQALRVVETAYQYSLQKNIPLQDAVLDVGRSFEIPLANPATLSTIPAWERKTIVQPQSPPPTEPESIDIEPDVQISAADTGTIAYQLGAIASEENSSIPETAEADLRLIIANSLGESQQDWEVEIANLIYQACTALYEEDNGTKLEFSCVKDAFEAACQDLSQNFYYETAQEAFTSHLSNNEARFTVSQQG